MVHKAIPNRIYCLVFNNNRKNNISISLFKFLIASGLYFFFKHAITTQLTCL